jgi:hypothetical protein
MELSIYGCTSLVELCRFFLIYTQSLGLLELGISQSQGRYLHAEQYKHNKCTQTSMPPKRFDPLIPVFERAKTVHALDRATTGISNGTHRHREEKFEPEYIRFMNGNWNVL